MKLSLHCPACDRPISPANRSFQTEIDCPSCGRHYGVLYGKLSRLTSIQEAMLYLSAKLPSFYKRHYTFQIITPDRTLTNLQFSIPGKVDVIPVHQGDVVSVLYTMQGYVMNKLVAIANHTTGKRYVLPAPIPSVNRKMTTLVILLVGFITFSVFAGLDLFLVSVTGAVGVLSYLKLISAVQLTQPSLETERHVGRRLLADQQLIAQQRRIEHRITELQHEDKASQLLIEQLEALKQKMANLDPGLYATRIYRSTTAITILKQQIANIHRLVREYKRTQKMIEIEIDTSWVADQLPEAENFTRTIVERLAELKAIEDQNQSLKLQLAAYEEVMGGRGIGE
ncbi:hypothetical protein [Leptodesmis sichuanensis]|uniref:hypothetical protein n=1 Tax=Leptodesmis sichuanensis TaxID=2906798 RepID=UPI001F26A90B|nr:hypothetical protein [Leptodesmis sichuanensis]UIE37953.1 hypothetical protein KIK02_24130 [Leptodesmis sichuanensis A121]